MPDRRGNALNAGLYLTVFVGKAGKTSFLHLNMEAVKIDIVGERLPVAEEQIGNFLQFVVAQQRFAHSTQTSELALSGGFLAVNTIPGVCSMQKKAVAAISLSGPTSRMNSSDLEDRIEAVCNTARDISGNF